MNITLIYLESEEVAVEKEIYPYFKELDVHRISIKNKLDISQKLEVASGIMIPYLPFDELLEFLKWTTEKDIQIVILPHPGAETITESLGLVGSLEEIIKSIGARSAPIPVEILYCNGTPVLESVKTGTFFAKDDHGKSAPWLKRWQKFFRAVFNYANVIYQPFSIKSGDEKIIDTCAIGLLAVEHARTSVLSLQWVAEEEPGDGQFHFFIVSPRSVFDLIRYIFTSVVKRSDKRASRPDFIGYIKSHSLEVTGTGQIKYFHDGEEKEAESLKLEVRRNNLLLFQETEFAQKDLSEVPKKSLRLKGLPTGEAINAIIGKNIPWLPKATAEDFKDLFTQLRENASTSMDYMVMLVLSTVIATFGLYGNSSPVIIGAMILAPLMAPIVAFAMGVVRYDVLLLQKGIRTIFFGTLVALGVSIVISQMIPLKIMTYEMQARLSPTLLDLGIAVASGMAAGYAHAKEGIAQSLAGVAIAVALVPPLAVSGIGIGWMDWHIFSGAFLLYLTNLAGIILFAGFTFWFLGFTPFKRAGKGLLYTLFIVLLLWVPLSFSFNHIAEEARITQVLEGYKLDNYIFREVEVRYGDPMAVEFKLVSPEAITNEEMERIKDEIQKIVGKNVTVRMISSIEF